MPSTIRHRFNCRATELGNFIEKKPCPVDVFFGHKTATRSLLCLFRYQMGRWEQGWPGFGDAVGRSSGGSGLARGGAPTGMGQSSLQILKSPISSRFSQSGVKFVPFWSGAGGCVRPAPQLLTASHNYPTHPRSCPEAARLQALASDFWPVPGRATVRTGEKSDPKRVVAYAVRAPAGPERTDDVLGPGSGWVVALAGACGVASSL